MPCQDISELHRLLINQDEELTHYEAIKKSCGSKIENNKELNKYLNSDILSILDKPYSNAKNFFERKFILSLHSCISTYLGLEPMYNGINAELVGIEYDQDSTEAIIKISLEAPVQDITPCKNGCSSCGDKASN